MNFYAFFMFRVVFDDSFFLLLCAWYSVTAQSFVEMMRKQVLILLTQISHFLHTMDLTFSQILRTMITDRKIPSRRL